MNQLLPCSVCQRHIRVSESVCPFCGAALDFSDAAAPVLPRTRLGRAATFAFGATIASAAVLTSCGETDDGGGQGGAAGVTASGGSSTTGGSGGRASKGGSTGVAGDTGSGGTTNVGPVYGTPPGGAGNDDFDHDAGSPVPLYGAAPAD